MGIERHNNKLYCCYCCQLTSTGQIICFSWTTEHPSMSCLHILHTNILLIVCWLLFFHNAAMFFSGWWYSPANLLLLTFYRQVVPSSKKFVIIWGHFFTLPKIVIIWYWQIKPLVKPTNIIVELPRLQYSWHDFISKSMSFSYLHPLLCFWWYIDWCCGKIQSLSYIGYLPCKKTINILSLKETKDFLT